MAAKIIWAPSALTDLQEITAHIAADNRSAALALGAWFVETGEQAGAFPRLGKIFRKAGAFEHRELIAGNYRLIYRYDEPRGLVVLLRIWHGARGEPQIPHFDAP